TDILVEPQVPIPSELSLATSADSGAVGDGITNVSTPIINGFGEAGDDINLFDGGVQVGAGTVQADGTWFVQVTNPLPDGMHNVTATESDLSGIVSELSLPVRLTIDTISPAVPSGLGISVSEDRGNN